MSIETPSLILRCVYQEGISFLKQYSIENAAFDARLLLCHCAALSAEDFILKDYLAINRDDYQRYVSFLGRRVKGESIWRIIRSREFYGLPFKLSADTLEPRGDSEVLVDTLIAHDKKSNPDKKPKTMLDLGTGTGALLLSALYHMPHCTGVGVDLAYGAARTADQNAQSLKLHERSHFMVGSWMAALRFDFDYVLSNPPYIASKIVAGLEPIVKNYDPMLALDGGDDGLGAYRSIFEGVKAKRHKGFLKKSQFFFEIGYDQAAQVCALGENYGLRFDKCLIDLGGQPRLIVFS